MMGFAVIVGASLVSTLSFTISLLLGFVTSFSLAAASMTINDYYDRQIDAINEPSRPIPKGDVSPKEALIFAAALTTVGLVAAFKTNFLFPNTNLFYHVPVLTGYDALGKRNFFEFMQTIAPCRPHLVFHLMQWSPPIASPWLDFLNTKYIVTPLGISLPDSAFTRIYPLEGDNIDSKHMLFQNKNSLSRAFLATRILGIMEPVKVRAALTAPSFDPRSSVILNIQDDYTFPVHYKDRDRCEITRYTPAEIALSVDHKEPRVLVLSDTWDPGWKAFVDGERVPVFQANLTFRGIILYQPGRHEVIFKYDPFSFRLGTMTALATLLGTIYWFLLVGKKRSKSQ